MPRSNRTQISHWVSPRGSSRVVSTISSSFEISLNPSGQSSTFRRSEFGVLRSNRVNAEL